MRKLLPLVLVIASLPLCGSSLFAQSAEDQLHAPDGGAMERIASIYLSPLTGAPFQMVLAAEWTKQLPDGSTKTLRNHRLIVRDSQGRIYQERRMFVPDGNPREPAVWRIEISDPAKHTKYFCDAELKACDLHDYYAAIAEPVTPAGPLDGGKLYLSRASLGSKLIDGVEVTGTRETVTVGQGTAGNTAPIDFTKELWYSARLGINLEVSRFDPLHGDQIFTVNSLRLDEPDARLFVLPAKTKVTDLRQNSSAAKASPAAP